MKLKPLVYFLFAVSIIMSCGDSEDGLDGINGVDGTNVLFNLVSEPAGSNCEFGGTRIDVGNDTNANDDLDADEIQGSTFVCNGVNGTDGVDGNDILVKTEVEPIGDNCAEGGSKMSIGLDVNGDGILNDTEITEVVYICNGESAASLGKTYITLRGDLSDAEVASILERDLGENTQFIDIQEMPNITTLDFSGVKRLTDINIYGCDNLINIDFENLEEVYDDFQIDLKSISNLNTANLKAVYDNLFIRTENLETIDLNKLSRVKEMALWNKNLIDLKLSSIQEGNLIIDFGQIENFDFSFLVGNENLELRIEGENLKAIDLSNLTKVRTLNISNSGLENISLNNLVSTERDLFFQNNSALRTISSNSLISIGYQFYVQHNYVLTEINVPALKISDFYINSNESLSVINLNSLIEIPLNTGNTIGFSGNKFNSDMVNYILRKLVSVSPTLSDTYISLGQNPSAPPTGQGLIDKATLEANNNYVSAN